MNNLVDLGNPILHSYIWNIVNAHRKKETDNLALIPVSINMARYYEAINNIKSSQAI